MSVIESVTGVFSEMFNWFADAVPSAIKVFYDPEKGLNFLGVLTVCGLSISIFFLLIGLIQNFLHFRG